MPKTTTNKIHEALIARGEWLVTAESCTGGMIAARLTDRAGSSAFFRGGAVAYSNALKMSLLEVPRHLLENLGAVSVPVARAMAEGALRRLGGDWAIAVTGVAGPGASEEKPAGLVYIAVAGPGGRVEVTENNFAGGRGEVRAQTVEKSLELLWAQMHQNPA